MGANEGAPCSFHQHTAALPKETQILADGIMLVESQISHVLGVVAGKTLTMMMVVMTMML